jgi:hypothetical protein
MYLRKLFEGHFEVEVDVEVVKPQEALEASRDERGGAAHADLGAPSHRDPTDDRRFGRSQTQKNTSERAK